ncbi:MAG: class I SAM-dependent methyltransferase [Candidatus Omnitrophica bacterium]|nr:class I SAM-dependent methyltransferase [Candidatus Omnitrophota bacterium]
MLNPSDEKYLVNHPIVHKYRIKPDLLRFRWVRYIKDIFINERIVEVPFALQALSGLSRDKKILDLGCGESILPLQLAVLGYQVTGLDCREYPYPHPNLCFVQGNILSLPFAPESFDAVLSISTLEHVGRGSYQDPVAEDGADSQAVKEIERVLVKNGLFILTIPYGQAKVTPHQRIYDEEKLQQLLKFFEIEEKRYFVNFREKGRLNHWQEMDIDRASCVEFVRYTDCVCLVKARRK